VTFEGFQRIGILQIRAFRKENVIGVFQQESGSENDVPDLMNFRGLWEKERAMEAGMGVQRFRVRRCGVRS
jgi:hypothetical protein